MAPIKFEEQLRDKLEKRELSPSAESWSKLAARLDAEDEKSKKPLFWLLSIAAGIVIMIAVSIQFIRTDGTEQMMPKVVQEQREEQTIDTKASKQKKLKPVQLANEDKGLETKTEHLNSGDQPQIINYKKATLTQPKVLLAETDESASDENKANQSANKDGLTTVEDEVDIKMTVTSVLEELDSQNTSVTDKEVDSLLKLASKELFKDRMQKETLKTVDANALLRAVEEDMGQSFRSRVFEALKESYETVKTAVAERNN